VTTKSWFAASGGPPFLVRVGLVRAEPEFEPRLSQVYRLSRNFLVLSAPFFAALVFPMIFISGLGCVAWVADRVLLPATVEQWLNPGLEFYGARKPWLVLELLWPYALPATIVIGLLIILVVSTSRVLDAILLMPGVPSKPFVLYLRSFFIETTIKAVSPFIPFGKLDASLPGEIQRGLGRDRMVCKIGSRKLFFDFDGGIVWSHDKTWFDRFKLLAERAEKIVLVPIVLPPRDLSGDTPGTLKEIEHIGAERLARKTVLVVPPPLRVWLSPRRGQGTYPSVRTLWETSRQFLKKRGVMDLPAYPGESGLLLPRDGGWTFVRGVRGRYWNSRRALEDILVKRRLAGSPGWDAARLATRFALVLQPIWLGSLWAFFSYGFDYLKALDPLSTASQVAVEILTFFGSMFAPALMIALAAPLVFLYVRFLNWFHLAKSGAAALKVTTTVAIVGWNIAWYAVAPWVDVVTVWLGESWRGTMADAKFLGFFAGSWLVVWLAARWVFSRYRPDPL